MALSRELTRRLQVDDEPLAKRLKLAENAFTSTDLPVTRKEDLVLKWLCKVLENNVNQEDEAWSTLHRCLKYKTLSSNIVLKSDIKESLVQTMINKLTDETDNELENVWRCCELIFSTCEMQQYFQSKPACLVELMKALLRTVSRLREYENSKTNRSVVDRDANPATQSGRKCAASAVECFVNCYKQSLNKDEFPNLLVRKIIYPLCGLIDLNASDRLGAEIHKCIQQIIFGKSRYSQFASFDENDENNFANKVFAQLKKNSNKADPAITVVAFSYIFRAAVGSYKNDSRVIDLIFRNIVDSAGPAKIELFGCLSEQLANITFDYQNKIGDSTLFEYLQKIIDEIIQSERLGSKDFDALAVIATINPLIIETKLQILLKKILLQTKETTNDSDSYEKLMISILDAEVRLRREQKLVPWIITAIKETIDERENEDCKLDVNAVFPMEFKKRFTKAVSNMTSMQMIGVFRSLTFHLNALTDESVGIGKNTLTSMLRANVDLMSAFFRGVRIFDHSVPLTGQEKFVQALDDLGKTLGLLTKIILKSKHKKKMLNPLLEITWYWDNMYNWLKYYAPDATTKTMEFPISEDEMNVLVGTIDNSENMKSMNRILVQEMGRKLEEGTFFDSSNLLGNFEHFWSVVIDENPRIIKFMDNSQIVELSRWLIDDAKARESTERLNSESVQNDERLVKALVCQTFADLASRLDGNTTKNIVEHVNVVKILNRGNVSKLLKEVRKELLKNEWTLMNAEMSSTVERNLQILVQLPLPHLPLDLRTLTLLVVHAIAKECEGNFAVCKLCGEIISDVSEKSDVDVIDYIDAESLMRELSRDIGMRRVVESSLRKISSWETLKELIDCCKIDDESVAIMLECVERTRTKSSLTNDQKSWLKKAERKLSKKLVDSVEDEVKDHREVKRLSVALTAVPADIEIPVNLLNLTKSTLDRIFLSKDPQDEKLVAEGLQLVRTVLKKRSRFEMSQEIVENVWPLVLKNPSKELADSLLQTTQAKALNRILQLLHKQTISGLEKSDETNFSKALIMWDSMTNAPMKAARDKYRIVAILNLLEALQMTVIPSKSWPTVLQLIQSIFARHSHAIEKGIDVITLLASRSLREIGLSACDDVLAICFSLTKFNVDFVVDRLPVLLAIYRQLVGLVVRESRKKLDSVCERKLRCLALDIAKFTNSLIKLKKELARISPYVIADLVEMFSEGVIPFYVKGPLEDSVGHFLSICDHHAVSLLSRALPPATQEIFKKLYETYNKFYKYTGKI